MTATTPVKGGELSYDQISVGRRWFLIILVSIGSSIIYAPAYLKSVFYKPLQQALGATNTELGAVFGAYAITALVCYLPSGIIADRVRMRTLASVGFLSTAVLTGVYAMLPSLWLLYIVFVAMGITTIFIWWGVRYKLVRLVCTEEQYPKRIGMSYGIYGVAGLGIGFVSAGLAEAFKTNLHLGVSLYLWFLAAVIFILGILSLLFIPKFEGEIKHEGSFSLAKFFAPFLRAFRNPVVWIAAISLFFVYFFYTGVNYTTPFMTDVLGADNFVTTVISNFRTYGITLLAGPAFGFIANRLKPSITILGGSVAFVVGMLAVILLPENSGVIVAAAVVVILLGFVANGSFGVVSAQLTEGRVPLYYFGAATGLLSIIGFLPDTFSSIWFGAIMDAQADAAGKVASGAYQQIFWILIVAAVLAAAFSALLFFYIRKNRAKLAAAADADQAETISDEATSSDLR